MRLRIDSPIIDEALGGGLPLASAVFVYGEPGTGKTTFALQLALAALQQGFRFVYVDALGKLSFARLRQLAARRSPPERPSLIIRVHDLQSLWRLTIRLERLMSPWLRLIIVDSVTRPYRAALGPSAKSMRALRMLNQILALLTKYARYYGVLVLATGDVLRLPDGSVRPVAEKLVLKWFDVILHLHPGRLPGRRLLVVKRHPDESLIGRKVECIISEFGVGGLRALGAQAAG